MKTWKGHHPYSLQGSLPPSIVKLVSYDVQAIRVTNPHALIGHLTSPAATSATGNSIWASTACATAPSPGEVGAFGLHLADPSMYRRAERGARIRPRAVQYAESRYVHDATMGDYLEETETDRPWQHGVVEGRAIPVHFIWHAYGH